MLLANRHFTRKYNILRGPNFRVPVLIWMPLGVHKVLKLRLLSGVPHPGWLAGADIPWVPGSPRKPRLLVWVFS